MKNRSAVRFLPPTHLLSPAFYLRQVFFACLMASPIVWAGTSSTLSSSIKGYTLRIEMSPAQCLLKPQRSKLRQCKEGFSLTVAGLRPEPSQDAACSSAQADLAPLQAKVISRLMPDKAFRDLAWQNYGACAGFTSKAYFHRIAKLSSSLKIPKELSSGSHYKVNKGLFINHLMAQNAGLKPSGLRLMCQQLKKESVLTEVQICYNQKNGYGACQTAKKHSCPKVFFIRGLP